MLGYRETRTLALAENQLRLNLDEWRIRTKGGAENGRTTIERQLSLQTRDRMAIYQSFGKYRHIVDKRSFPQAHREDRRERFCFC